MSNSTACFIARSPVAGRERAETKEIEIPRARPLPGVCGILIGEARIHFGITGTTAETEINQQVTNYDINLLSPCI